MTHSKLLTFRTFAATVAMIVGVGSPVGAQEAPVDLSGIWWANAPVPLLPGESPAMGMGMGMGGGGMGANSRSVPLNDYGRASMIGFDPADDPAVSCVQAGLVRQITSPYPMKVEQHADTVTLQYEEWEIERTVHLNTGMPEDFESSPMGYSVGHYEGDVLVVATTGATRGLARSGEFFWTSEEASTVERYSLTERGQLSLVLVLTDPVMLSEPWRFQKTWNAYDQDLLDFDCILRERP